MPWIYAWKWAQVQAFPCSPPAHDSVNAHATPPALADAQMNEQLVTLNPQHSIAYPVKTPVTNTHKNIHEKMLSALLLQPAKISPRFTLLLLASRTRKTRNRVR
jgi:hypothetical protein